MFIFPSLSIIMVPSFLRIHYSQFAELIQAFPVDGFRGEEVKVN